MRRRKVSFSYDPRWTALKRAGLAVSAALVLLLGVLWFGDSDQSPRPPAQSAKDALAQSNVYAPNVDAPASMPDTKAITPEVTGSDLQTSSPQPPPEVTKAPVKPDSLPDGYFVQLGVFDDTDNAARVFDNAVALDLPAHIQSRVMVGPFRNEREAEAARDRLKDIAEGTVLSPQKTAEAQEKSKAKSKSRRRAK